MKYQDQLDHNTENRLEYIEESIEPRGRLTADQASVKNHS